MAHGLTPELIGAGGRCRAVSHQPRIQPPSPARPGGEGWREGMEAGREGQRQHPASPTAADPLPRHPPGFLPLAPAAQEAAQGWG